MDLTLLIAAAIIIILALAVILFLLNKQKTANQGDAPRGDNILPGARRRQLGQNRNLRQRRRRGEHDEEEVSGDEGQEKEQLDIQLPDEKVGAKKLAKLQAKAEKKAHREAEEKDRQDKKKKQEQEEELRKKHEEKEKEVAQKIEEEEKKIREKKEKQEHEEYLKLKEAFSIESEGFEEADEEGKTLQDFVNHIKMTKVVVIEDIAAQFKLKAQHAIDRIQQMQADGILSGVIDDRGKFIYISREELDAVAKFVKQRGRVSIAELVDNSNMLVDLTPTLSSA